MHPYILDLGFFKLPAYGLLAMTGYLAAYLYLLSVRGRIGASKESVSDLSFFALLGGLLGGKLLFIVTFWDSFGGGRDGVLDALKSLQYGFVFYGGLAGGAAALWYWARRHKAAFAAAADFAAPALALAHGFGRLGCLMAGCCHGAPAGGAPGLAFTDPLCLVEPSLLGVPLHPVQLYESLGNFIIFGLLHFAWRRKTAPRAGSLTALYVLLYSMLRFSLEFLRGDDRGGPLAGLSQAQLISLAAAAAAAAWLAFSARRNKDGK
ncbi:MAG: phosphatidylglycerol:prolipoprotein diacylglycerol transferase [Elusimicrobia bacterium]|nr:MAG: phosphatidylglycerol:prolipoprotein diacylglycerol transferase [Elusimicrobiota bacterium]KAF0156437.1 MAG: phosphatidylglycerol:prolipoprotein diacylglycerol transferase [Elusimicrobiota bacterium]